MGNKIIIIRPDYIQTELNDIFNSLNINNKIEINIPYGNRKYKIDRADSVATNDDFKLLFTLQTMVGIKVFLIQKVSELSKESNAYAETINKIIDKISLYINERVNKLSTSDSNNKFTNKIIEFIKIKSKENIHIKGLLDDPEKKQLFHSFKECSEKETFLHKPIGVKFSLLSYSAYNALLDKVMIAISIKVIKVNNGDNIKVIVDLLCIDNKH